MIISSKGGSAALPAKPKEENRRLDFAVALGPPSSSPSLRPLTLSGTPVAIPQSTESRSVRWYSRPPLCP